MNNFGTGRGLVGDNAYLGLRCFGAPSGLEVSRILSFMNPPIFIPWTAMDKIDTFPSLLTGRKEFETDMQAQITLRGQPNLKLELPWLAEYRQSGLFSQGTSLGLLQLAHWQQRARQRGFGNRE